MVQLGEKFAKEEKAAQVDNQDRKKRAAISIDPKVRKAQSSVDTPEEKSRAKKYHADRFFSWKTEAKNVIKRLEGDSFECL